MDLITTLASIPDAGAALPYVTALVAVCAALATVLPHPAPGATGLYAKVYAAVNFVALNFGRAKNAGSPASVQPPSGAVVMLLAACLGLAACSSAQEAKTVAKGQLFCAKATATGPLVVALADAAGAPVIATGAASAAVTAACGAIGAVPVSPPANPAAAPVVAAAL